MDQREEILEEEAVAAKSVVFKDHLRQDLMILDGIKCEFVRRVDQYIHFFQVEKVDSLRVAFFLIPSIVTVWTSGSVLQLQGESKGLICSSRADLMTFVEVFSTCLKISPLAPFWVLQDCCI